MAACMREGTAGGRQVGDWCAGETSRGGSPSLNPFPPRQPRATYSTTGRAVIVDEHLPLLPPSHWPAACPIGPAHTSMLLKIDSRVIVPGEDHYAADPDTIAHQLLTFFPGGSEGEAGGDVLHWIQSPHITLMLLFDSFLIDSNFQLSLAVI